MDLDLSGFRKNLHAHPELSGKEAETAKKIKAELEKSIPDKIMTGMGGHGLAAIFKGKKPGKTIVFRAELDALPIQEINTFDYASKTKKVSHKCGHDGHMSILIGLAKILAENPPEKGTAVLLFQPAEETGDGAKAILKESKFTRLNPDYIFALHNIPGYKKGEILCKTGTFTPAVSSISIKFKGKTSHAAEPEKGINPDLAVSELIPAIKQKADPDENSRNYAIIATVFAHLGSKDYGISAGKGEVHFTLRCLTEEKLSALKKEVEETVQKISNKHNLECSMKWIYEFAPNTNNPEAFLFIKNAAKENHFAFREKGHPFPWGEDFGLFTQKYKGAMFGLGAGENTPALHNPDYDFPDGIIAYGVKMFRKIFDLANE